MALDAERYRREVLDPARRAGNRPPDDLIARYQLTEPLNPGQVRTQVEATLTHWHKQKASLAYRKVIDALEAEHRRLHAMFDGAGTGDLRPLQAEIEASRARRRTRSATLRGELTSLAGSLGMLVPEVVEQMAAQGYDPADVQATIRDLRIEVRAPDDIPAEAPVRGFLQLHEAMGTLNCRHIADFLFGREDLAGGFSVLDGFAVPGRPALRLDDGVVRDTATRWARRLEGKSVPESVLSTLRRLSPAERAQLLVYECAHDLRTWRDLRADSAALEQRAVDLGLVKRDAQRFAFAVASERGTHRSQLAAQLEELFSERHLVAAHRLVSGLGDSVPEDCRALAEQAIQLGGKALELQRQARAATDPDTAWRLLDEAVQLAADLSDVEQLRRQWPPAPPRTPTAMLDGTKVALRWSPSPSTVGTVRYVVRRSTAGRLAPAAASSRQEPDVPSGVIVAETAGTTAEDASPPVNVPCVYSVVATRDGVASAAVGTDAPVWFRPELADLAIAPDDGVISVSWSPPPGASRVLVRRGEGRAPRDAADGEAVQLNGNGFIDRRIRDGVTYHYLVVVGYVGASGREALTAGQRLTGASTKPPQPVRRLHLESSPDEPGLLVARFEPPEAGEVELRQLDGPPPQPYGTRLPAASLPGLRCTGVRVAGGIKCPAPAQAAVLVAVTVSGDRAVVGDHAEWVPPTKAPTIVAQRRGDGVHLSCEWPPDVVELEVRWRAEEQAWQSMVVSAARYGADGGIHLPRQGDRTEIVVAAVVRGVDRRRVGPGSRILVVAPVSAAYTVRRPGLRRDQVLATVTVASTVRIPRLLLLAGMGDFLPLRATDGEVLAELVDVVVDPVTPAVLHAALPARSAPYFLRCFAPPGDVVELRDPPREQLRVR